MHAGFWVEGRAMGAHTLYDADCPDSRHYLAEITFKGERRRESGIIEYKLSESGINEPAAPVTSTVFPSRDTLNFTIINFFSQKGNPIHKVIVILLV